MTPAQIVVEPSRFPESLKDAQAHATPGPEVALSEIDQLQALLDRVRILPLGLDEAQAAGRVRARLEQEGASIGLLDSLIAGTALHHGATLVTHNVRELGRVEGLKVVDWY